MKPVAGDRGLTLGTVLMVAALACLMAFTLAASSLAHLQFSNRLVNARHAEDLADSTVSWCIDRLLKDSTLGTPDHEEYQQPIEVPGQEGAVGRLIFDPDVAASYGIPYSTNNLAGESRTGWNERVVPRNSAHLVAVAEYRGVTRTVEAVVHLPPYPFALAASGPVEAVGAVLVAAVDTLEEAVPTGGPESFLPGDMVSNSAAPEAIRLASSQTAITGDVLAAGGIRLDPQVVVLGQVRPFAEPAAIPQVKVTDYDPVRQGRSQIQQLEPMLTAPVLEGFCRSAGDFTVLGDLTLDGGVVYVEGSLRVTGGIRGKGAVIVTGATSIDGGVELNAQNQVALLSQGDVTLAGAGQATSSFQGLVYTEGNFTARQVSLVGTFVANRRDGEGSQMKLTEATVFQLSDYQQLDVEEGSPGGAYTLPFSRDSDDESEGEVEFGYELNGGELEEDMDGPLVFSVDFTVDPATGTYSVQNPVTGEWVRNLSLENASTTVVAFFEEQPGADMGSDEWAALRVVLQQPWVLSGGTGPAEPQEFHFDLNEFLTNSDEIRVLLWRTL